ncbi:hypothetical protein M2137_001790 [Parabacteroides sp. PFB2-10]|uniref:MobC family plasmid mobilization relaxosome protein n=1 Tax=Parabacteroides sp. PFB2-10 TaxID=1742405 RepID=UPI0024739F4A|nr:MobC family plasmid mobilization relaxosome protein [Parabacteroides sp. PFB2-10]MDH6313003.1 hypothetical protein [Parabacteroides sp. PFB2-10]
MENKKEKKTKVGRPAKEKAKLSTSINLKLTEDDFNSVKEKAEKLGMKATQYVREMTLKGCVKSRFTIEELDLMRKLSGIANNMNQIARKVNAHGLYDAVGEVFELIGKIRALFHDR